MKIREQLKKFRSMDEKELNEKIADLKEEIFNIRFQLATSHSGDFSKIRQNKRMIARIKTIITEKQTVKN
ncbi:50S ribosomal protein L29 [bacterium]|nr:50S ribosomal protein L29 [bacterium]